MTQTEGPSAYRYLAVTNLLGSFIPYLKRNKKWRAPAAILDVLLSIIAMAVLGYFCWYLWLPQLWNWGFSSPSLRAILASVGSLCLLLVPFIPLVSAVSFIGEILNLTVEEETQTTDKAIKAVHDYQSSEEQELARHDKTGLMPVIRYSRIQMEAYYTIGLRQAQHSYRYSVLAMWVGFSVIIIGIALFLTPISKIQDNLRDVQILTIASGIVIELVSGLFLWIYRSSIVQLDYFYNRQIYMHNILICAKITESMQESDATKRHIVEKILEQAWGIPEMPKIVRQKRTPPSNAKDHSAPAPAQSN